MCAQTHSARDGTFRVLSEANPCRSVHRHQRISSATCFQTIPSRRRTQQDAPKHRYVLIYNAQASASLPKKTHGNPTAARNSKSYSFLYSPRLSDASDVCNVQVRMLTSQYPYLRSFTSSLPSLRQNCFAKACKSRHTSLGSQQLHS